jgi:hypothetical protein
VRVRVLLVLIACAARDRWCGAPVVVDVVVIVVEFDVGIGFFGSLEGDDDVFRPGC